MEEMYSANIAGLIDGAGAITAHIAKDEKYSVGYRFSPVVSIFRHPTDEATLGKLDAFAEEHGIHYRVDDQGQTIAFKVWHLDSIERFLEEIYPWLVTKHEAATIMLEEVIPRMRNDRDKDREGFLELVEFADILRDTNRQGPEATYTMDYFKEEWELEA